MMSCHLQKGKKNKVAFVFSCPGRYEEIAGYPAAKVTGNNLNLLLKKLEIVLHRNDLSRKEIIITNSWDKVEYQKLTGRSEATDSEVLKPDNITRLYNELKNVTDFIVCCGNKAKLAVEECNLPNNIKILYIEHLGTRGLNTIKQDVNNNAIQSAEFAKNNGDSRSKRSIETDNNLRRLDVVCNSLLEQFN